MIDFKSVCLTHQIIYGRHISLLYLAVLASVRCPENLPCIFFRLVRQTDLKYINLIWNFLDYDSVWKNKMLLTVKNTTIPPQQTFFENGVVQKGKHFEPPWFAPISHWPWAVSSGSRMTSMKHFTVELPLDSLPPHLL